MGILSKILCIASVAIAISCGGSGNASTKTQDNAQAAVQIPKFNADSAYSYVARQTEFGPRVPGSQASQQCAQWLLKTLNDMGAARVTEQRTQLRAYNGDHLDICNISASFNPDAAKRVLLLAHWDSRPWADMEEDPSLRNTPIDGANDGASGVGVILEIARNVAQTAPRIGVDILFVDAEDYGRRADEENQANDEDTWALGTQYWIQNPTLDLPSIRYAVLLDMVGGKDAVFKREYFSQVTNQKIADKVWREAKDAGYADRFPNEVGNPTIDDHVYLIKAGIPAIDIIETQHPETGSFNPTWHTHADNIDNIDAATMQAVGQTLLNVIYKEK